MEDKILKFATAVVVVLTVAVCIGLPFFPQIHTWAVESREERLAEQEYAENQTEMKDLEIVAADTSEQVHGGQLQLKLPEGINGSDIQFTNDYVTQTIKSAFREQTALILKTDRLREAVITLRHFLIPAREKMV